MSDDLRDAPPAVREAQAYLDRHLRRANLAGLGLFGGVLFSAFTTAMLHDVAHVDGLLAAVPLLVGLAGAAVGAVALSRSRLGEVGSKSALVARYRQLREIGLPFEASPQPADGGSDRVVARIVELAGDRREVVEAAQRAQERVRAWESELAHLDSTIAEDPAMAEPLTAVRERLAAEIARGRAGLAETWAALVELQVGGESAEAGLEAALGRLKAEAEVERASRAARARQTQ